MQDIKFICPLCNAELKEELGNKLHVGDKNFGTNLYCPNINCPAQEVSGHGDNVKQAYEVILQKYKK